MEIWFLIFIETYIFDKLIGLFSSLPFKRLIRFSVLFTNVVINFREAKPTPQDLTRATLK